MDKGAQIVRRTVFRNGTRETTRKINQYIRRKRETETDSSLFENAVSTKLFPSAISDSVTRREDTQSSYRVSRVKLL